jgi:glycosyltransferase involved in cell wall biosynthesis
MSNHLVLKILFITHYTELYGANRSLLALVKMLAKKGAQLLVLVPDHGDITAELSALNIPFCKARFFDEYYYKRGFSRFLGLKRHLLNRYHFKSICGIAENFDPDIIHSNSAALHLGARLAYQLHKPHVWHIREFGLQDYRAAHNLGEKHHLKWLNRAAHIISISVVLRKSVLQEVKVPISIIYNGVMPEKEMHALLPPNTTDKVVFTLAGSLRKEKGQETALKAFVKVAAQVPQAMLYLPGDASSDYGQYVQQLSKDSGFEDKIMFPGFLQNIADVYKDAGVLLMCSKNEAMGRVTAEAFARHIPVIAYNGGANPELIAHNKDGLLYQSEDELVEAMLQLARLPI